MGGTKGNDPRNIQSHNKTHTRVRFHHMVTNSIRHEHQQTTDNTKHRTQNGNWVHNRHKHTTSTRRNTHTTYKGTPPTTRITDKTKITAHSHYTTSHHNKQHPDVRNKQHTTTQTTPHTLTQTPNTIDNVKIKTSMKHIHTNIVSTIPQQPTTQSHKHHTTHSSSLRNNTPPSNPSYPGPTQNKHNYTLVQLHQHIHTPKSHGCVDGSRGGGAPAG